MLGDRSTICRPCIRRDNSKSHITHIRTPLYSIANRNSPYEIEESDSNNLFGSCSSNNCTKLPTRSEYSHRNPLGWEENCQRDC